MFRGTTARALLAALAVTLLVLLFSAPADTFAPAHPPSEATAGAGCGSWSCAEPEREETDPVRGSASRRAEEHPLIAGRAAGAGGPSAPGTAAQSAPRSSRAHAPAALQVFRC
ncbi:hypothetical protein [Streptomyces sp. NBC_00557]|uniref:hypothetical protein n=1 Tax=Streptomyces sp. NBC_00557 TaxID=2975776 RepID=UPI002E81421E|nr:hypothetical protein [Streptomyces sp. NBC_00557]WUC34123.1 hypothetical protein OG956_07825 [Streptomyces sp. NBC_00557]